MSGSTGALEGHLDATGLRFAIVVSRFHESLSSRLLDGARDCLLRHGARGEDLTVVRVPGSFEIPGVARQLAASGRHDAVVCLGVLVRGETPHFDLIAHAVSRGVARAGDETGRPVTFGVVTAETTEQATERAGGKLGNRGFDAALAAIEMARLLQRLQAE